MFIVRTGSVELRIGETVLETVEQGGIFGELALVDPAPRSATAVAGRTARWCWSTPPPSTTWCGACPASRSR